MIDDNAPLWFLHCNSTEHSSIVLAKTNMPTLNHVAFEMPDFDSVMRGMGRMKDNGYPIEWGPGRHGPGNNVFAYFCGPDELPIEYTAEVLQIDDSYVPRGSDYWKFPPGRSDHWGITQPRSARYYRVQRLFNFTRRRLPAGLIAPLIFGPSACSVSPSPEGEGRLAFEHCEMRAGVG